MNIDTFNLEIKMKNQLKSFNLNVNLSDAEKVIKRKDEIDYFLFTKFGRTLIEYTNPQYQINKCSGIGDYNG